MTGETERVIAELQTQLRQARSTPCEWCVSTTNLIESQSAEIEELKEKIKKDKFPSYLDHLKVSTLTGGRQ